MQGSSLHLFAIKNTVQTGFVSTGLLYVILFESWCWRKRSPGHYQWLLCCSIFRTRRQWRCHGLKRGCFPPHKTPFPGLTLSPHNPSIEDFAAQGGGDSGRGSVGQAHTRQHSMRHGASQSVEKHHLPVGVPPGFVHQQHCCAVTVPCCSLEPWDFGLWDISSGALAEDLTAFAGVTAVWEEEQRPGHHAGFPRRRPLFPPEFSVGIWGTWELSEAWQQAESCPHNLGTSSTSAQISSAMQRPEV